MTETPEQPTRPSAATLNAAIRALWIDGVLPVESRGEYEQLVVDWAAAMRAEQELAA
ncbi:hypothetical protein ACFXA4_00225 [Streptomyces sp. NPDC059442]|uniref:hypothetical protein n=1 Tax=Streptomyces sp. NPDC059442 TaxID=3346830 RepID=UPI0036B720B2